MKNTILLMSLAVATAITSFAQGTGKGQQSGTDYRDMIQLGVKAGANLSNVYDSRGEDFQSNSIPGLATGVFVAIPVNKLLGFQPEILFSQKGFHATGRFLGSPYEFTRTTTYFDIPLLVSVKPNNYLNLLAGPQYSYLVKQNDVFSDPFVTLDQEEQFENDNIRRNTLGFLGGLDIDLGHIVFGARVGWDLQNNNGDGTSTTPRYKNVWIQATLGYRLFND
jgi:hypothetical protein